MSPPATSTTATTKKRAKPAAEPKKKQVYSVPIQDPATGQYNLHVRASQRNKTLQLTLSEPAPDEECSITLEPIQDYRLSFMQDGPSSVLATQPNLTKASLPCGHGFNALALLYHFAKNSMTCPICRAGHAKAVMTEQSIPVLVRKHFSKHLASLRAEESHEQIASDAIAAAHVLEQEVSRRSNSGFMPMTRIVLILYAFDSMDVYSGTGLSLVEPILALELPLTSSLDLGTLAFESFGYSLAQLNLNLLRLPTRPRGFEIGVGVQSLLHGNMLLFRTVRFPATGHLHRVVFARDALPTDPLAVEVLTMPGVEDFNVFYRLRWVVPVPAFSNMVLLAASVNADGGQVAAV